MRLHTKNQLPGLPGSALKVSVVVGWWGGGGGGGVVGWVPAYYVDTPNLS